MTVKTGWNCMMRFSLAQSISFSTKNALSLSLTHAHTHKEKKKKRIRSCYGQIQLWFGLATKHLHSFLFLTLKAYWNVKKESACYSYALFLGVTCGTMHEILLIVGIKTVAQIYIVLNFPCTPVPWSFIWFANQFSFQPRIGNGYFIHALI